MWWEAELMEERRQGFLEGKKEGLEEGRVAERKASIYNLYHMVLDCGEDSDSALECVEQYYPAYSREELLAIINGYESEKDIAA